MPAISKREPRDTDLIEGNSILGEATYAGSGYARTHFSEIIDRSKKDGEKTLITEHNKPAAAVVSVKDFRILKLLDSLGISDKIGDLTYKEITPENIVSELGNVLSSSEVTPDIDNSGREESNVQYSEAKFD